MLRTMLEFEQNDLRKDSTQIALVAHCLAMLWFLGGDSIKVRHLTRSPGIKGSVWHSDTVTHFHHVPLLERLKIGLTLIDKPVEMR